MEPTTKIQWFYRTYENRIILDVLSVKTIPQMVTKMKDLFSPFPSHFSSSSRAQVKLDT